MIQKHFVALIAFAALAAESASAQVSCQPGTSGVITCPCANNPSGPGRGCNNSLNTGGAALSATGSPSLSADNIQFNCTGIGTATPTCSGTNVNVISLLYQGTTSISAGIPWGDGVICTGGPFYLLNAQVSNGGIYHWPVPGTTGVSAMAISLGDPLSSGQTRHYFVAYRDSCPTFCTSSLRQKSNSWSLTWTP